MCDIFIFSKLVSCCLRPKLAAKNRHSAAFELLLSGGAAGATKGFEAAVEHEAIVKEMSPKALGNAAFLAFEFYAWLLNAENGNNRHINL